MARIIEDTRLAIRLTRNLVHYGLIALAVLCTVVGAAENLARAR